MSSRIGARNRNGFRRFVMADRGGCIRAVAAYVHRPRAAGADGSAPIDTVRYRLESDG